MSSPLRVFIGWDRRENEAYEVARHSLLRHASIPVEVFPIKLDEMVAAGFYWRSIDPLATTEFTYSRFLTPALAGYQGWALFVDCDFLFFGDVADLMAQAKTDKAVYCVQHDYRPKETTKMDGVVQTVYPRKNWSSFLLFNCDHPSVRTLTPKIANTESGAYLHRLQWVADEDIGELATEWNWLEGWNEIPAVGTPKAVHYTRGGPWFKNWQNVDYAKEWLAERDLMQDQMLFADVPQITSPSLAPVSEFNSAAPAK